MRAATLEHVNFTVSDCHRTAERLCKLFDWKIRWQGPAMNGGRTAHVGTDDAYLAIYQPAKPSSPSESSYETVGGLNHVGVVVDDLDAVEKRIRDAGYKPHSHANYEPGRRFYFDDEDGIEYEVVSYA
jgi:hypothetical protein